MINLYWNETDQELVVTWTEAFEQRQVIIEPHGAVWTGEDSDVQFTEYPAWCFQIRDKLLNKIIKED